MLETLKLKARLILAYLSDSRSRRAIVGGLAVLANHYFGWTNDPDMIATTDVALGIVLAVWSNRAPDGDA